MFEYAVTSVENHTPTTLLLNLKIKDPSHLFNFQPGQYVTISFKRRGRRTPERSFSVVSSPTDQEKLQVSMRVKGRFTKALTELQPGDTVWVRGPFGSFIFDSERYKKLVLVAGGIGITPFMSMINYAAQLKLDNKITLFFSTQTQDDVPFARDIIAAHHTNPNFKPVFVITAGPASKFAGFKTATGRITPDLVQQCLGNDFNNSVFFICGPPPFMKAIKSGLVSKGVGLSHIKTEAFSQGTTRQTGSVRSWPFNVYLLTGVGLVLGSFAVMVSDLLKVLPPINSFVSSDDAKQHDYANLRQDELNAIVNQTSPTVSVTKQKITKTTTAPVKASTPAPTIRKTPTPAPQPAPTPVCTTNASGITTCQ